MEFFVEVDSIIDESPNHFIHAVAGGVAGVAEHVGMFPLDTLKTYQQAAIAESSGVWTTLQQIFRAHGLRGFFRGLQVMLLGVAPIHSVSFSVYEGMKRATGADLPGQRHLAAAVSGIAATLSHDALITPLDTVKQRMQRSAREYRGMVHCFSSIHRAEGFRAFYAGYTTTLVMNVPFAAVYYASYEGLKRLINGERDAAKVAEHAVRTHLLAGALCGAIAAGITNPLDVARTRLQIGSDLGRQYRGMFATVSVLRREEGMRVFLRGIYPRMGMSATSGALSWSSYEYIKFIMTRWTFGDVRKRKSE